MRILEIKPRFKERKFLLLVEIYERTYIFDLEDRTMKNFISIKSRSHENTQTVKTDCSNNLVAIK